MFSDLTTEPEITKRMAVGLVKQRMLDLIERLDGGAHPSFGLEQEIMWSVRNVPERHQSPNDKPPNYTYSIDKAVLLVPYGAEYEVGSAYLVGSFWATVITPTARHEAKGARTAAMALTVAALKARAALCL